MAKSFPKVVVAAIIGAIAGLLLAPKSGKETRADLKAKAQDTKEKAALQRDKAKATLKENAEEVKGAAKRAAQEAKEFTEEARSSLKHAGAEAVDLREKARIRANRVADDAKSTSDRVQKNVRGSVDEK